MSEDSSFPAVSVVICSYSEDRWDRLMGALDSVRTQTVPPKQTIVVVDYNVDLYKRLIFTVPDAVIVENTGPKGLSGARNTGAGIAKAEIVAFLDDDAELDWSSARGPYDDPGCSGCWRVVDRQSRVPAIRGPD
jgi:glycosyltransferase involved in cell wall biosynthesis